MFQSSAKVDPTPYNGAPYMLPAAAPVDTGGPVSINYSLAQGSGPSDKNFTIGIFTVGNTLSCLYSFLLPHCAAASARSYLDGSDCCLNLTHLNPVVLRWMTRSAYNIEGSSFDDLLYGLFLPCCTINQVLQTTSVYGRPYPGTGKENNSVPFVAQHNQDCCANCVYASCCLPCAIGTSMNQSMGMPFWMGCLCTNYCIARNMLRYQYRLQGHDCWEECATPYGVIFAACVASVVFPCAEFVICPYFISMVMMMLSASKEKGNPDVHAAHGSYLHPLPANMIMGTMFPSGVAYSAPPQNHPGAAVYTTATIQPAPVVTTTASYAPYTPYTPSPYPVQQTSAVVTGIPPPYPANGGVPISSMPMQTQPVVITYSSTPSYQPGPYTGVASQPRY